MKFLLYILFIILLICLQSCTDDDFCYVTHCKFMYDKGVSYEYCYEEKICHDEDISIKYE